MWRIYLVAVKSSIARQNINCAVSAAKRPASVAAFGIIYIIYNFILVRIIGNKQPQHIGMLQHRLCFVLANRAHTVNFVQYALQTIAPPE